MMDSWRTYTQVMALGEGDRKIMTTDIVDIEQEIITNDLSGDKIERLLFQAGFDSEYTIGPEGLPVVEVRGDDITILVSEPWAAGGTWFISPGTVSVEKVIDDRYVASSFPTVETEDDLVAAIEDFAESE